MKYISALLTISLTLVLSHFSYAQIGSNNYYTAKALSMGNVGSNFTGIDALFTNPAGTTKWNKLEVLLYADNRFGLNDLTSASIGVLKSINPISSIGITASNFGLDEYKEQVIGLMYARQIIDELSMALKFNYLQTQITGFGAKSSYTYEIGVRSELNDQLSLGAHILSGNQQNVTEHSIIPSRVTAGIAYQVEDNLSLHADFVKFTNEAFDLRFGVAYDIHKKLNIRLGGSTNPAVFSGGISYQFKALSIELGSQYYSTLQGVTPGIGIIYRAQD